MAYYRNNAYGQMTQGMQPTPYITCGAMPPYMNQQGISVIPAAPVLPTGVPTGPSEAPLVPAGQILPAPPGEQAPQTVQNTMYTPGFLRTQIGRRMRVEFLIGSSGPMVDRIGTLLGVGASYILLRPIDSDDILLCDIYSIKFVTILL